VRRQVQIVLFSTSSLVIGIKVAWQTLTRKPSISGRRRVGDRLSPSQRSAISLRDSARQRNSEDSHLDEDSEEFGQVRSKDS